MRSVEFRKFSTLLMLSLSLMAAGCATGKTQQPPPIAPGQTSASALQQQKAIEPLACSDFVPMRFHPGLDGVTALDIQAAISAHQNDPIAWVRGLVGDTDSTREQLANYQGRRIAIGCKTY